MTLDQDFEAAAETLKSKVNKTLTDEELKEVYALYKQATAGDINIEKPGMLDLKGCAKWEAWNSKKGLGCDEAKEQYIDMVGKMKEKHGML